MIVVVAGLLLISELVHSVWLVRLPLWGQVADPAIPLVIAIAFRRPDWGLWVGLGTGLLQDLLFGGSLGLFALAKLLVGQGAAIVGRTVLIDQPLLPWATTAGATVVHQATLTLVLGVTALLPVSPAAMGVPLLAQVGINLLMVWPAFALTRLVFRVPRGPRPREGFHVG